MIATNVRLTAMASCGLIASLISPAIAIEKLPFIDLNSISAIQVHSESTTFKSANGVIRLNSKTGRFAFEVASSAAFSPNKPSLDFYALRDVDSEVPDWYPKSVYLGKIAASQAPAKWLLTANAGEGATYDEQDLIDVDGRRIFKLPFEEFLTFAIDGKSAWVGGNRGLSRIDLETLERWDYRTLPAFDAILGIWQIDEQLVCYLTAGHGLFFVRRATGEIIPAEQVNSYSEKGYRFFGGLLARGRIWLLARQTDKVGRYLKPDAASLLLGVDPKGMTVSAIDSKIAFADSLILHKTGIIGFGSYLEGYEGGETATFGGAFNYEFKSGEVTALTHQPVASLGLNPPHAISIVEQQDLVIHVQRLEGGDFRAPLHIKSSEWITDADHDVEGYDFSGTKRVLKGDRKRFREMSKLGSKGESGVREKAMIAAFGALKVQFKMEVIPAGTIQSEGF